MCNRQPKAVDLPPNYSCPHLLSFQSVEFNTNPTACDDVFCKRIESEKKYNDFLESLFKKYGRDTSDIADEVDLATGEIIVNNGHLEALKTKDDIWDPTFNNLEISASNGYEKKLDSSIGNPGEKAVSPVHIEDFQSPQIYKFKNLSLRDEMVSDCVFADEVPLASLFVENVCNETIPSQSCVRLKINDKTRKVDASALEKKSCLLPNSSGTLTDQRGLDTIKHKSIEQNEILHVISDTFSSPRRRNPLLSSPKTPLRRSFSKSKVRNSNSAKRRNFISLISMISPRPNLSTRHFNLGFQPLSQQTSFSGSSTQNTHSSSTCKKAFCFQCISESKKC